MLVFIREWRVTIFNITWCLCLSLKTKKHLHSTVRQLEELFMNFPDLSGEFLVLKYQIPRFGKKIPKMTAVEVSKNVGYELRNFSKDFSNPFFNDLCQKLGSLKQISKIDHNCFFLKTNLGLFYFTSY